MLCSLIQRREQRDGVEGWLRSATVNTDMTRMPRAWFNLRGPRPGCISAVQGRESRGKLLLGSHGKCGNSTGSVVEPRSRPVGVIPW
ncbi:MAG: hypothetical protein M3328_01335 [Chloroflexota bacterium]|nr:hypothetical protein [Chloroflexota bacterium]